MGEVYRARDQKLGREVAIIDRDTKQPEVYRLAGAQYLAVQADPNRWIHSDILSVRLTRTAAGRLVLEDVANPATRAEI